DVRLEERPAVAGALDGGEHRALGQGGEFVPRPRRRPFDAALDGEAPGGQVEVGHGEVIADEEEAGRRDPGGGGVPRRLAVLRRGGDELTLFGHGGGDLPARGFQIPAASQNSISISSSPRVVSVSE